MALFQTHTTQIMRDIAPSKPPGPPSSPGRWPCTWRTTWAPPPAPPAGEPQAPPEVPLPSCPVAYPRMKNNCAPVSLNQPQFANSLFKGYDLYFFCSIHKT